MDDFDKIAKDSHERVLYAQKMKNQNRFYNNIYRIYGLFLNIIEPYSFAVYGTASKASVLIPLSELISIVGFFGACLFINGKSEKETTKTQKFVLISFVGGLLVNVIWLFYYPDIMLLGFWFGGINVFFSLLCYLANSSMTETENDVKKFLQWTLENEKK